MKRVVRQIARLLDDNHIGDERRRFSSDWWHITTDALTIDVYDGTGPHEPKITFNSGQNYCHLDLSQDSIESIGMVENDQGVPLLHVSTKAGHCVEFALIKKDEYERTE